MKKLLITFSCAILTACGGGGGGNTPGDTPSSASFIGSLASRLMPGVAVGDFVGDGGKYVVVSGWLFSNGSFANNPVKIYKLSIDGGGTDVTSQVLGNNIMASTHVPLVADFNGDGIDDIFLPGFFDTPVGEGPSYAYISRRGTTHRETVLPDVTWSHDATTADIDGDGDIDVVNSTGKMWINDGLGNFTFKDHSWQTSAYWMSGNGVCVGDFNNSGRKQVVITDLSIDSLAGPIADTAIFELDSNLNTTARHYLPAPILDRTSTVEQSHDYTCRVADINNDGLDDIIVFSRPWASARNDIWNKERYIQVLINRGNFQFDDSTSLSTTYAQLNTEADYMPLLKDFNGDGKIDLWFAPDLFLNNGSGAFRLTAYLTNFDALTTAVVSMNNKYGLFYIKDNSAYFVKPTYSF